VQVAPHTPQSTLLVIVSTQFPLQSVNGALHEQAPPLHVRLPWHGWSQKPQAALLVIRLTHVVPSQSDSPERH
jgi:hypothetical protein